MPPIPSYDPTPPADDHPLTPAQLALYLHARAHPGDASLNLGFAYRLGADTDPERLAASIRSVLEASAALSTVFVETEQGPVARVFRPGHRPHAVPVRAAPGADDDVAELVAREADTVIAPEAWPQPRCGVYTSSAGSWLTVVTSHLVADATTHAHFMAAVAAAYRGEPLPAALAAHPGSLPRRVDGERAADYLAQLLADPPETVLALEPGDTRSEQRFHLAVPAGEASITARVTAAHAIVVAALSGRDEVVVGVPIAGRSSRAAREASGCFVRTVPVPIRLGAHASIAALQAWLDRTLTGLLRHQDSELGLGASTNTVTIYRRALAFPLGGAVSLPLPRRTLAGALQLSATVTDDAVEAIAALPARLAEHGIARMYTAAAGADPRRSPAELAAALAPEPSVTPIKRRFAVTGGIAEAVLAAVASDPTRIVLADERGSVTAAELSARVEAAAAAIEAMGPDRYLGVALPPGIDLVVTVLGVLRAGRAYVPLDPDGPAEYEARIRSIVAEAQGAALRVLRAVPRSGTTAGRQRAEPDDPAYVIFTSGSTGEPKGVEVSHRGVLRLLAATHELVEPRPTDVWCLFHSAAFDFSVWELFGSLVAGARLSIPDRATVADPLAAARFLRVHAVSVLNQTPSAFRRLLDSGAELPGVRLVLFGGEVLDPQLVQRWPGGTRFVDLYGITEGTVHVTAHPVDGTRCIGQPLADLGVAVVDAELRPVPRGVSGELLVWGDGVARGYLARAEAAAERFRTDLPFAPRVLRTGDRVRMRGDGALEYLGRLDRQRKLRGHRVEPGEVEATLLTLPGVTEAVVLPAEPTGRQPYLAAWLRGDAEPGAVRAALAARLPAALVPAVIERIDVVPMTRNGKVDEAALLARLRRPAEVPDTDVERIAALFARVIGVPSVRADTAFFDAGGTSMHLVELSRALRAELGIEARIADLFEHPSPRSLAEWSAPSPSSAAPARPPRRSAEPDAFWVTPG